MLAGIFARKNINQLDDQTLMVMVKEGRGEALAVFFERYSLLVLGLSMKYLKNRENAEDMTMKLFEDLPSKIKKSEIGNFRNWLYSVSRNECLMQLRRKGTEISGSDSALRYQVDETENDLATKKEHEINLQTLESEVTKLSIEQQGCIRKFYLENKSYDQISEETGYDLKKVKSYIQNGKRNLKMSLENNSEFKNDK